MEHFRSRAPNIEQIRCDTGEDRVARSVGNLLEIDAIQHTISITNDHVILHGGRFQLWALLLLDEAQLVTQAVLCSSICG